MTPTADRLLLIIGAGASVDAPANRPTFARIGEGLLEAAGIPEGTDRLPAPEILLYELERNGIDAQRALLTCVDGGQPNAVHAVAAEVLRLGGVVWTTNYDTLIERAYGSDDVDGLKVSYGQTPDPARHRLCKPHGSAPDGPLVFNSSQVVRPLEAAWRDALLAHARDRTVVVVGYAGADVDLYRPLRDALHSAAAGCEWFIHGEGDGDSERESTAAWVQWRFSISPREPVADASRAFVEWAAGIDPALRVHVDPEPDGATPDVATIADAFASVRGDRFSQACLRIMLGTPTGLVRLQIVDLLTRPRAVPLAQRAKKLVSTLATRHLFGFDRMAWWLARWVPAGLVPYTAFIRAANWAERAGRYEQVKVALGRRPPPPGGEAAIDSLLNRASTERYLGRLDLAISHADEALARARDTRRASIDRVARAAFEGATSRRWHGDWDGAEEVLRESLEGIGSPRWNAWVGFDRGILAMHRGELDAAMRHLRRAIHLFDSEDHVRGAAFSQLALITVRRAALAEQGSGAGPLAVDLIGEVGVIARQLGAKDDRATRDALDLEWAELHRLCGETDRAGQRFRQLVSSDFAVSRCLGHLGAAALAKDSTARDGSLRAASIEATASRCAYLHGRALAASPSVAETWSFENPVTRAAAASGRACAVEAPILFA